MQGGAAHVVGLACISSRQVCKRSLEALHATCLPCRLKSLRRRQRLLPPPRRARSRRRGWCTWRRASRGTASTSCGLSSCCACWTMMRCRVGGRCRGAWQEGAALGWNPAIAAATRPTPRRIGPPSSTIEHKQPTPHCGLYGLLASSAAIRAPLLLPSCLFGGGVVMGLPASMPASSRPAPRPVPAHRSRGR